MHKLRVTCAILWKEGKVLLARRPLHKSLGGKWEFPGGKVEPGETEEACLIREISEELSIHISITRKLVPYEAESIVLIPFLCEWIQGELIPSEHAEIAWVAPENLLDYDLSPADIPVAKQVL